jgi:type IV pilus biogenesis protein CpaD/CtpE
MRHPIVLVETERDTTVALLCGDGGLSRARKLSFSEEVDPNQARGYVR